MSKLFIILSVMLVSASASAEHIRRAGNHECYSSSRGYFFSKNYKACPGKHMVKPTMNKAKMCSCPCKK